ncbi:hypothetical protein AMS68_001101 [Peltaster fructicola]|uniref:AB hydrolase-1 domain-containing protein n=1 Tax=Peltaster fructicola TaxID=286661 RepID=A0A6H0XLI2_9PEZI|nr:hypothetical protein AMS68_001101 [Peltaster fructicola]
MAWPSIYGIDVNKLTGTPSQPAEKPTIVLVHDAFLTATHMLPLHNGLLELDYRVQSPQLPSTGFVYQADIVEADIEAIVNSARSELRAGRNIVMVVAGYGAVPATIAADRLNLWSLETPRAGRVVRFVFISALLLREGERVGNAITLPPNSLEIDRMIRLKDSAAHQLFQPCRPTYLTPAVRAMQHLNSAVLTTPNPVEAWRTIPSVYIVCELDNNLIPSAQEQYAARLQADNPHARVLRVPFGHAPYTTNATQLTTMIDRLSAMAS